MKTYKVGNVTMTVCDDYDEAIAYADALKAYRELWMMIVEADQCGLISAN